MATWHQRKRPVNHQHETQWTVVVDPPNEFAYAYRASTLEDAEKIQFNLAEHGETHSYILKPSKG